MGYCHEDYLPTNRGFDTFRGPYIGWVDHYNYTHYATGTRRDVRECGICFKRFRSVMDGTKHAAGGGAEGYDCHHDGTVAAGNDVGANQTYSTV